MKKAALLFLLIFFIISSFFKFSVQSIFAKSLGPAEIECNPDKVSLERDPRPAKCNLCDKEAPLTPSCATSLEVFDEIEYKKNVSEIIEESWSGMVTIDPSEIEIPFVGKRNMEEESWWETVNLWDTPDENAKHIWEFWEISNASEEKYLTDYLEGTNEYYRNHGNQTTLTNYQGILRKLTPYEYQNQLKRQLVARAQEKEIHDYKIKYIGRFCWDFPFWLDATKFIGEKIINFTNDTTFNNIIAFFSHILNYENPPKIKLDIPDIGHYCLYASLQEGPGWFIVKANELVSDIPVIGSIYDGLIDLSGKIPGLVHFYLNETAEGNLSDLALHSPPDPNEEKYKESFSKYQKDFLEWKNRDEGKWYRLWQATPMLSREDTQGEIDPYLANEHEDDSFEIENEESAKIEAVPHLARLYEGSQIIHQILTPKGKEVKMFKTDTILKAAPPYDCFKENYLLTNEDADELCCQEITGKLVAQEEFRNPNYPCHYILTDRKTWHCIDYVPKEVSRGFGVNLYHPYLDEIWSYSTYADSAGFFNIFRPYGAPQFEDIDAADTISYKYNTGGDISPQEGRFYFPHLIGIQTAKEYVVNKALWPYEEK